MHIKFENGSAIQSITANDIKRGRRALMYIFDDKCKLKWYQKLWFKIYCFWIDIDIKIRPWKYWWW